LLTNTNRSKSVIIIQELTALAIGAPTNPQFNLNTSNQFPKMFQMLAMIPIHLNQRLIPSLPQTREEEEEEKNIWGRTIS